MKPPRGLWGVADGLPTAAAAERWARGAAACAAWTLRRPACGDRVAAGILRGWAREGRYLAVHGRGDLARAGGAQAAIAGHRGLPLEELLRVHVGLQVGASVHSAAEVAEAARAGASFVLYGPVWDTPSKRGLFEPRGLDALAAVCAGALPVVAIGGVESPEQVAACAAAGAHAVAVLRAAMDPPRCAELAAAYSPLA